jgi:hypothetical protein
MFSISDCLILFKFFNLFSSSANLSFEISYVLYIVMLLKYYINSKNIKSFALIDKQRVNVVLFRFWFAIAVTLVLMLIIINTAQLI